MNKIKAARLLRCHPNTLLRKARSGVVPCVKPFHHVFFRASELNAWLARDTNADTVRVAS
jgi:hypothetical protein